MYGIVGIIVMGVLATSVVGFRNPDERMCSMSQTGEGHGVDSEKKLDTLPYKVIATSDKYEPGKTIEVQISDGGFFRGFFFEALDKATNQRIAGKWATDPSYKVLVTCNAAVHPNHEDKELIKLFWHAPETGHGDVKFVGSIVRTYSEVWSNIVAEVKQ